MNLLRRLLGEMETPRLVLRHWRESDLEDFLAFAADPAVMLDSGARPATTFEEEQTFFRRALWDSGCYAIVLKETGRPIGKIKFQKDIRRPKGNSLSIGYELARAYWGRGYMTEALAAMVRCAFERKHVDVLAIGHSSGVALWQEQMTLDGAPVDGTMAVQVTWQRIGGDLTRFFLLICGFAALLAAFAFSALWRKKDPAQGRVLTLGLFAALAFLPSSWAAYTLRVYRDNIFPALCLYFFAGMAGMALRAVFYTAKQKPLWPWLLAAGLGLACAYLDREDAGMFLLPFAGAATIIVLVVLVGKRRWLCCAAQAIPYAMLAAGVLTSALICAAMLHRMTTAPVRMHSTISRL